MALPSDDKIIATIRGSAQPNIIWGAGDQLGVLHYNFVTGYSYVQYIPDDGGLYPIYEIGDILAGQCEGTTYNVLRFSAIDPYFIVTFEYNSSTCGYIPPTCDISLTLNTKTDCNTPDNNNGYIKAFASSSYPIIAYELNGPTTDANLTGEFFNLVPGIYNILARDQNGCESTIDVEIYAFEAAGTDLKYILEFTSIMSGELCRLEFHDKKNLYDTDEYPKQLTGSSTPITRETKNSSEDKAEAICPASVKIGLLKNGLFTIDEFALSDERTWYIKYYIGIKLKFQGWILPDEVQDSYEDDNYYTELTATDGLLSLKGDDYSDITGVQQFGVYAWKDLVYNCLRKLDYDLGQTIIFSSLRYNNSFDSLLWEKIGTWADLFYDDNGDPKSTYDVLEILMRGMSLTLFQEDGRFIMVHWNDLYHIQNPLKASTFNQSIYSFNSDFSVLTNGNTAYKAQMAKVGYQEQLKPVDGRHPINYDRAFGTVEADINFQYFTLLYPNPSFEIGAVTGQLPPDFVERGEIDAGLYQNETAYTGDWILSISGYSSIIPLNPLEPSNYLSTGNFVGNDMPGFPVDQVNQGVNFSFYWRPMFYQEDVSIIPAFLLLFVRTSDNQAFAYRDQEARGTPGTPRWDPVEFDNPYSPVRQFTTDYLQWNNFTVNTPVTPGIGVIYIRFYGGLLFTSDNILPNQEGPGPMGRTYQIDQVEITLTDGSDAYNKQIGEKNSVVTKTNFAKSQKKTVTLDLFTYPPNKRIAGNIFYGTDYLTGIVSNNWGFALGNDNVYDRLQGVIVRELGKQYQRPVYIFEGGVIFSQLNYYCVFLLAQYDGLVFMPFSISWDDRNGTATITMVQINDEPAQNTYIYRPKFEKSARKVQ